MGTVDNTGVAQMMLTEKPKRRPRLTKVAAVEPLLLREPDAASFIGKSPSWMRQRRFLDIALSRSGKPTIGPAWVQVESSIFYEPTALRAWVEAIRVDRGAVEWRGRSKRPVHGAEVSP